MQITVKVKPGGGKKPATVVRDRLKDVQPGATVEEVFPDVQAGRRAGMVVVNLPDSMSDEDSETVIRALRGYDDIEYAERAGPRKPKSKR